MKVTKRKQNDMVIHHIIVIVHFCHHQLFFFIIVVVMIIIVYIVKYSALKKNYLFCGFGRKPLCSIEARLNNYDDLIIVVVTVVDK
jgi:hypothetical protein